MKRMTGKKWMSLLAVGMLGLWPTAGLRAQAAATMADAETSSETIQCDTIRMTWEAEAGEWKEISFTGDSGAWYRVDWGDGMRRFVYADGLETTVARHGYIDSGTFEVLLCGLMGTSGFVDSSYLETAFGMELSMVYVEGGTFAMGCTAEQGGDCYGDEKPVHSVTLSDFYIGAFEVTQGQWEAVMGTTVEQQRYKEGATKLYGVGDDYPMYYVNWYEANEFCAKLSELTGKKYRLPTEAEWEYAARGGLYADETKYAGSDNIGEVAWYEGNSGYEAHPVGSKQPNGLGLYDMSGNVWEWCQDWYGSNYYSESPVVNPQGPSNGANRVVRGGSWNYDAYRCRVSYRRNYSPDSRYGNIGFRVVCVP